MKCCAIAIAILISEACNALGASDGVIQLSHAELASPHEEIQQLALRSSSSLQSEASRASDMNPEILGYKANESPLVQLRTNQLRINMNYVALPWIPKASYELY